MDRLAAPPKAIATSTVKGRIMLEAVMIALLAFEQSNAETMSQATKAYKELSIRYTGGEYKDEEFKYRLLAPAKIEDGKKYPLVIFLHGAGERGEDNALQLKYFPEMMAKKEYREKYACFVLAPQCPEGKSWAGFGRRRSADADRADEPTDTLQAVMQMTDKTIKENPIDTKRLYLTGLSMGGFGSWDWAVREPERFAAVVPICGGGQVAKAEKLVKTPIWAVHGDKDESVPVERSREMIEAIKKAGGAPKYTELPGVGHNSWTPAYSDPKGVVAWMFEQKKK